MGVTSKLLKLAFQRKSRLMLEHKWHGDHQVELDYISNEDENHERAFDDLSGSARFIHPGQEGQRRYRSELQVEMKQDNKRTLSQIIVLKTATSLTSVMEESSLSQIVTRELN